MKILHRYLLKEVIVASLGATATLTLIALLFESLKKLADMLVNNDISTATIIYALLLLIPSALTLTIPCGLLTGVVIVFGRMCHSLEITAIRSAGLGLIPFIAPVILLSLRSVFFVCIIMPFSPPWA
ncbi:MAG: LptF/LptG family permease [Blastochloris sp.]|nr:LptF/LptG family permease [Blastochloris sp.]